MRHCFKDGTRNNIELAIALVAVFFGINFGKARKAEGCLPVKPCSSVQQRLSPTGLLMHHGAIFSYFQSVEAVNTTHSFFPFLL
jgi:hypothetical protein